MTASDNMMACRKLAVHGLHALPTACNLNLRRRAAATMPPASRPPPTPRLRALLSSAVRTGPNHPENLAATTLQQLPYYSADAACLLSNMVSRACHLGLRGSSGTRQHDRSRTPHVQLDLWRAPISFPREPCMLTYWHFIMALNVSYGCACRCWPPARTAEPGPAAVLSGRIWGQQRRPGCAALHTEQELQGANA